MGTVVSIDGALCPSAEDAKVSVFDRGFLYGDSVFEVMRTYGGVPFAEREHLERLARSCERLLIELPVPIDTLAREIRAVLDGARNVESYVRVVVTRGSGPLVLDPSTARDPLRVIIVKELDPQPAENYTNGVGVALVRVARATDDTRAAGAKASNYLGNLLALHEARSRGCHEAVVLGPSGDVIEGASSNVFVVRAGAIFTPPKESGLLEGITRAKVVALAQAEGISVTEAALFPRDLYDADEVFLTSTLREVVPIVKVDGERVAGGTPGPVTQRLLGAYRRLAARAG